MEGRRYLAALLIGALILVLAAACGQTAGTADDVEATTEAETVEAGGDTEGESSEPDTGRMSEGEYGFFTSMHEEVVDESLQWSEGFQPCAVIGQSGDFAGFRECVQEAWDGTEGALLAAASNAEDLLDDTAKACRKQLRRYRNTLENLYEVNVAAYEAANSLDFEAMTPAFNKLPKAAKRYVRVSNATLAKCEPR